MGDSQRREIDLIGNTVEYEVRQSPDANEPRIDVDIHGIKVVVPDSETVQPHRVLKENAAWVVDKQHTYDTYREQVPDRTFESGEQFPYLGEDRELVIESTAEASSRRGYNSTPEERSRTVVGQTSAEKFLPEPSAGTPYRPSRPLRGTDGR